MWRQVEAVWCVATVVPTVHTQGPFGMPLYHRDGEVCVAAFVCVAAGVVWLSSERLSPAFACFVHHIAALLAPSKWHSFAQLRRKEQTADAGDGKNGSRFHHWSWLQQSYATLVC